jgi:hypothetical protein
MGEGKSSGSVSCAGESKDFHPVGKKHRSDTAKLALGALGVVYGDICVDSHFSATRKGWSERSESCDEFMKFGRSSSGCESRPVKGKAAPAGSEPCDGRGNAAGDA